MTLPISHQAMIEKEPITVVISEKGWIRAMKGHIADLSRLAFKEGDRLAAAFHAETTDKVLLFATGGKFYTLGADKLPGGRGHGEPMRLHGRHGQRRRHRAAAFVHEPGRRLLLVSTAGNGFVVPEAELVANTRKGKQVMNVTPPAEARLCVTSPKATTRSRSSARTARCWSSRSTRCRR